MGICLCQHCSTQPHSSPDGDRPGSSFTPFQHKRHIEKVKLTIEPKSIPKIPTSASGSEFPQIFLDYYSKLTKSTFSTPEERNSIAQNP
ncbi:hypothetical protein O181_042697 [Austropuccinia psidii MF-1]|uniref:Uncharacterized protein n=1 Tax=Austropuccinia psidii MF-1 TaxID=1389203 RepID=A0A9Q3DNB6_9BASI|nr:hypothetical protein [Austropuccinia psidii MF-1]